MSVGKLTRNGLPFSNVVATGTATNSITQGRTLETFRLKLGGTSLTKAMITALKIKANGKVVVDTNGTDLDKINAYRGMTQDASYLDVQFADFAMHSGLDRFCSSFDTVGSGAALITSEVTITGATAPTLVPILEESARQKDSSGSAAPYSAVFAKLLQYPFSIATGGTLPFSVPFGPQSGAIIKRVHIMHGGNMTGATVKQDGMVIHESLKLENEWAQKRFGRVPQTNVYTLDFVSDGVIGKALNTRDAKSLEWLFAFSAADSGRIYVEYLDTLANL